MSYFACFMVGSWTFAMGWFLGAIYVQNHNEETESPRVSEQPERETEVWRLPAVASAD
jgi:hypothetical protein